MIPSDAIIRGRVRGVRGPLPASRPAPPVTIPSPIPAFHQPSLSLGVVLPLGALIAALFFLGKGIAALPSSLMPAGFLSAAIAGSLAMERLFVVMRKG